MSKEVAPPEDDVVMTSGKALCHGIEIGQIIPCGRGSLPSVLKDLNVSQT